MAADSPRADARFIAVLLRVGLVVALVGMVVGVALAMRSGVIHVARVKPFEASMFDDPGAAVAMLGILALAVTPALRVVALIVIWAREGDRRFAITACGVALVLVLAALLGRG
ncbi:MAG: DUF1634 domain-containing protein [Polyangiaceae bacterium]